MFFVYILYSKDKDLFYTGITQDIESRMYKHLSNHRGFTSKANDWVLAYKEMCNTKSEALQREKVIKGWKSRIMIEKLINSANNLHGN
jgi:putative endonuclease